MKQKNWSVEHATQVIRFGTRLLGAACVAVLGLSLAQGEDESRLDAVQIDKMSARFAPVDISMDLTGLPANERAALADLVRAAQIIDAVFLRQVSADNEALLMTPSKDQSALGRSRLQYFLINRGPWSRLDRDRAFLPGIEAKPAAANFYSGGDKASVQSWISALAPAERTLATGFFTTIRRLPNGEFTAVPYSIEYQGELQRAAQWLRSAAAHTGQATLRDYLHKRADAFLSNDYFASDLAWMDLTGSLEPTIGPYETYEDGWFGFKAAFEALIAVNDGPQSDKLARFSRELQGLEDTLPIEAKYRSKLGSSAPIRVVNLLFGAGDANRGIQLAAFNLPNDERVIAQKGSKRVMLKNFQHAKFDRVLLPSAKMTLARSDQPFVQFEPFFTHILLHELMHGLGPQFITVDARQTTVRQELKELYGPLEEAKADISGLWALQQLINKGVLPRHDERAVYTTFLASTFRTLRFGLTEAHAKGMALQLNFLLDSGAVQIEPDGTFAVDFRKIQPAVTALTHDIMTLQATGDYAKAKAWSEHMMVIRPPVQAALDRLSNLPVDIRPRFVTAEALIAR